MRALFLLISCALLIPGAALLQESSPDYLNHTYALFDLPIPVFAMILAAMVVGLLILIFTLVSYERTFGKPTTERWFVYEIVIGAVIAALLYAMFEKIGPRACVSYAGGTTVCIKSWLYYAAWTAAVVPLFFGLIGLLRTLLAAFVASGVPKRMGEALSHKPAPAPAATDTAAPETAEPRLPGASPSLNLGALPVASLPLLIVGGVLALFLLIFVDSYGGLNSSCYYLGIFRMYSCIPTWVYVLAWLAAMGLIVYGIFGRRLIDMVKEQVTKK